MSKRGARLTRRERDFYPSPETAARALAPHLSTGLRYYAPCVGEWALVTGLTKHAMVECVGGSDILTGKDAATLTEADIGNAEMFIDNPPWKVSMLHPIIDHLVPLRPTWLLLYSDWLFTRQAVKYHRWVRQVVTMPRMHWIPGTKRNGMDNSCWIHFDACGHDFLQSGWPD